MTVDQRFEQLERKTQRLEQCNKRLTVALTMMAVVMCAVVTMAATGEKRGDFPVQLPGVANLVMAKTIFVMNDAGDVVVSLGVDDEGGGLVYTKSAKGKELVNLSASANGGMIEVSNKTGEAIANMGADEYGNGVVGAWNRKGEGRTLQPGP
jgi:hypothetical protein